MVYRDGSCSGCPPCLWRKVMKVWTNKEIGESREVALTPEGAWDKINMYGDKNKENYRWRFAGQMANSSQQVYTWKRKDE